MDDELHYFLTRKYSLTGIFTGTRSIYAQYELVKGQMPPIQGRIVVETGPGKNEE